MRPAIRIESLSKRYRLGELGRHHWTLGDSVAALFRRSRANGKAGCAPDEIWALKDVSFDVAPGEVVGIIGRNGAGKSTLLKILSRITEPTAGAVELRGRVSSLLEVGTGFHPELTGRENVYLNGSILGMKKAEIDRNFDRIVDFAGVERFLDTPVKRYSSGMQVRLAFAVAAHLEPEILIVDEVLAVGDAEFQRKCLGKMGEVANGGRTVLFVSHNMAAVGNLCTRCLYLQSGKINSSGEPAQIIDRYVRDALAASQSQTGPDAASLFADCSFLRDIEIIGREGSPTQHVFVGDSLTFNVHCRRTAQKSGVSIVVNFHDSTGQRVLLLDSKTQYGREFRSARNFQAVCRLKSLRLYPGTYMVTAAVWESSTKLEETTEPIWLTVSEADLYGTGKLPKRSGGLYLPDVEWAKLAS